MKGCALLCLAHSAFGDKSPCHNPSTALQSAPFICHRQRSLPYPFTRKNRAHGVQAYYRIPKQKKTPDGRPFLFGRGSKTSADKVRCTMSRINVETLCVSPKSQNAVAFCNPTLPTYHWYVGLTLRHGHAPRAVEFNSFNSVNKIKAP